MEKQSLYSKIKSFYQSKRGKSICFFGFYFVFFLILAIFLNNHNNSVNEPVKDDNVDVIEKTNTNNNNNYDLSRIVNNNYEYFYTINDNNNLQSFHGTKEQIDYGNFENKYFLDIYNVNQLIKKSKFIHRENNILSYELSNSVLNDLLLTDKEEEINKIDVYVNENHEVYKIVLDLSNYFLRNKYEIIMEYKVGEA